MAGPKVRLYLEQPLGQGQVILVEEGAANYLFAVMRLGAGAVVHVFNGRDGEWLAEVGEANKRRGTLICREQSRAQDYPPDLWLLFTPIKKERTNFIVEKAVELGVARVLPVSTRRMNSERLRQDKQQAHAVEAAEQCGATSVPEVAALTPLAALLTDWPAERRIYWADEIRAGEDQAWRGEAGAPAAILIGPEGGFTPEERELLHSLPFVTPIALGPRILRAETAAMAAITLWQTRFGDWR
ncbi:16S rRNA (uracil(1498)-N(3))-methyltransferase [Pseudogemmobacter faecipullorum]|uniref:Ribosomal RNA small subunit methyltransferase E n=1 Tax=Pseudogemmobacter faecipullorum TaxID=2755041 RepID=A0ABS8CNP5_9RHOB|nr:16S rRNA (uracil(1498)-N(3))-methyltransferase [Pseudogemmobacter faecipullorum]MCB5410997.1 16S rRNA (uracil(1498)-N(3))-methyltransferase [Pseudogemmobacter faecipullorum]